MSKIESYVIVAECCVLCFSYTVLHFFWFNHLWFRFSICLTVVRSKGVGGEGVNLAVIAAHYMVKRVGGGEHDINLSFFT
jgi:hypothetical protein